MEDYYSGKTRADLAHSGYYLEKIIFFDNALKKLRGSAGRALRILDIGCNDGVLTKNYARYGKVVGIDINRQALRQARRDKNITYLCSDIAGIKTKYKASFDVVIAGDIIEHIFDTDQFLEDIKYVLTSGGRLLLTTPNVASLGRRIFLLLGLNPYLEYSTKLPNEDINCGHIRYYTAGDLRRQLLFHRYTIREFVGSRINLTPSFGIGFGLAKYFPNLSMCLMVHAGKPKP